MYIRYTFKVFLIYFKCISDIHQMYLQYTFNVFLIYLLYAPSIP